MTVWGKVKLGIGITGLVQVGGEGAYSSCWGGLQFWVALEIEFKAD